MIPTDILAEVCREGAFASPDSTIQEWLQEIALVPQNQGAVASMLHQWGALLQREVDSRESKRRADRHEAQTAERHSEVMSATALVLRARLVAVAAAVVSALCAMVALLLRN